MEIVFFWIFCAAVTAFLAANRGRNSFKWFALGLLIGPVAFLCVVWPRDAGKGRAEKNNDAKP